MITYYYCQPVLDHNPNSNHWSRHIWSRHSPACEVGPIYTYRNLSSKVGQFKRQSDWKQTDRPTLPRLLYFPGEFDLKKNKQLIWYRLWRLRPLLGVERNKRRRITKSWLLPSSQWASATRQHACSSCNQRFRLAFCVDTRQNQTLAAAAAAALQRRTRTVSARPAWPHCRKHPYIPTDISWRFPHFNGTRVPYTFVSVNRHCNVDPRFVDIRMFFTV